MKFAGSPPTTIAQEVVYVEVRGGSPLDILHTSLAHISGFRGLTQRDGKTYACFRAEPPPPIKNQLFKIAGKP